MQVAFVSLCYSGVCRSLQLSLECEVGLASCSCFLGSQAWCSSVVVAFCLLFLIAIILMYINIGFGYWFRNWIRFGYGLCS